MEKENIVKKAATLSLTTIEQSIPPTLLSELRKVGASLSVPWVGLLIGSWTPLQYAMHYSEVMLEDSDWTEPTIIWSLLHMPSGTRKSLIYKFVNDLVKDLGIKSNENDEDQQDIDTTQYRVNETTFEKLGLVMQKNDGKVVWYFDEGRHFFSQLGLYQKGSSRDESVLLTLYDAGEWHHSTAKGVQFELDRTQLALGGLTQTAHVAQLFSNKERMESGLIPRFLTVMLNPVHTSIRKMKKSSGEFKVMMKDTLKKVRNLHEDRHIVHTMLRGTKAFEMFASYHDQVSNWIEQHQYKMDMNYQDAITMVSKSLGQIFRLAGILNSFYLSWDVDEVQQFEIDSQIDGSAVQFTDALRNVGEVDGSDSAIPLSLMAVQSAIAIVTHALTQNLMLQKMELLEFELINNKPTIRDIPIEVYDSQTSVNPPVNPPVDPPVDQPVEAKTKSESYLQLITPVDVGKLLTSGGLVLNGAYCNRYRKIGSKTKMVNIKMIFSILENSGFGVRSGGDFIIHNNIEEVVVNNQGMLAAITNMGVSISQLHDAITQENNTLAPPPAKKLKENESVQSILKDVTLGAGNNNGDLLAQLTEKL